MKHVLRGTAAAATALLVVACSLGEESPPAAESVDPSGTPVPGQAGAETSETPAPEEETTDSGEDAPAEEPLLASQGVSAGHPLAAEAGEEILAAGGNAVDAAIATAFAVSVVEPYASGLGGGGSAIVAGSDQDPAFIDYREVVNQDGEIPDTGTGVPGFAAGMGQLHEQYGSMEWEELLAPAQELAAEGFDVSEFLALRMSQPDGQAALSDLEHFAPGGTTLSAGDQLVQAELGETISRLASHGWEDFYTGELAQSLAGAAEGIDQASLEDYEVISTVPVTGEFGDYTLVGPPPSLPGAPMIQMLQMAEGNGIADLDPESGEYVDLLSEAWLRAEESVYSDLGDPNFVQVPLEQMIDAQSNASVDLSASAEDTSHQLGEYQAAGSASNVSAGQRDSAAPPDAPNTTHISVVDEHGLSVSMTNTIMFFWGSGQMVDGYLLNNHLSRFDAIDTPANQPDPGRRTVTWSNPAMVLDAEGRPELMIGSPGGHQILNILGTVLVQWGLQDRSLEEAVATPRFRADGDLIYLEDTHSGTQIGEIENLGWDTEVWPEEQASFGSVQLLHISYDDGAVTSVDDPRREGAHRILD